MIGKTNGQMMGGGNGKLKLLWTNPNPSDSQGISTDIVVTANGNPTGFIVDAKRYSADPNDGNYCRNFVEKNTSNRILGYTSNIGSWARIGTSVDNVLTISLASGANPMDSIPMTIYAIY